MLCIYTYVSCLLFKIYDAFVLQTSSSNCNLAPSVLYFDIVSIFRVTALFVFLISLTLAGATSCERDVVLLQRSHQIPSTLKGPHEFDDLPDPPAEDEDEELS